MIPRRHDAGHCNAAHGQACGILPELDCDECRAAQERAECDWHEANAEALERARLRGIEAQIVAMLGIPMNDVAAVLLARLAVPMAEIAQTMFDERGAA